MKKIILLLFLMSNQALSETVHDEEVWKEFENLRVYYFYDAVISEGKEEALIKEGKLRRFDQSYDCNNECRKNYKALAERMNLKNKKFENTSFPTNYFPDLWEKEVNDVFIENIYENSELEQVIGQVITTKPLSFRIGDQFYTNENWFEDFKDYYDDEIPRVILGFPLVIVEKKMDILLKASMPFGFLN